MLGVGRGGWFPGATGVVSVGGKGILLGGKRVLLGGNEQLICGSVAIGVALLVTNIKVLQCCC